MEHSPFRRGASNGTNALRAFPACRPKGFAFRYPASQQKAKKLAPGNFFYTLFALLGFKSLLFYAKK